MHSLFSYISIPIYFTFIFLLGFFHSFFFFANAPYWARVKRLFNTSYIIILTINLFEPLILSYMIIFRNNYF